MNTSTPLNNPSRRRLLQNSIDSPLTNNLNDEAERSSRRLEVSKSSTNSGQNEAVIFTRPDEAKKHLDICTKLYAENKINAKNIWHLQVIDALQSLSKKKQDNILQIAGPSLEIGAKIYGMRVDEVHAATLRLARSMARHNPEESDGEGSGAEEDKATGDMNETLQKKKKKKCRLMKAKNCVAKDQESLLAPVPKLTPVLFSDRTAADMNTIESLCTNILPMHKYGHELMLLSEEKAWPDMEDETLTDEMVFFDYKAFPDNGYICYPFKSFFLNKWDEDDEKLTDLKEESFVVYDDNGAPVPELDGPLPPAEFNDSSDDDFNEEVEEVNFHFQQMKKNLTYITEMPPCPTNYLQSEYSCNSLVEVSNGKLIEQIWAGPSYWKLKCIKNAKVRFTGTGSIISKKKENLKQSKKKEVEPLDYFNVENIIDENLREDKIKRITYKRGLDSPTRFLLPNIQLQFPQRFDNFNSLLEKRGVKIVSENEVDLNENQLLEPLANGDEIIPDNISEDQNGCDGEPFNASSEREDEVEIIENGQDFAGNNLVEAPEYVPEEYIPYALHAKKIDIKKIKMAIWKILAGNDFLTAKEGCVINPITFSNLLNSLKTTLPEAMQKEVSSPLALVALLHLCNEKCLMCTGTNFKDFTVEKGVIKK